MAIKRVQYCINCMGDPHKEGIILQMRGATPKGRKGYTQRGDLQKMCVMGMGGCSSCTNEEQPLSVLNQACFNV